MTERDDLYDGAEPRKLRGDDSIEVERLTPDEIAERRVEREWATELVEDVDLKKLHVEGVDRDFVASKGYSHAEMKRWMGEDLPEIRRLRAEGYTRDDFARLINSPDARERSIGLTESFLFGKDAITVEWMDGKWDFQSGRHRVLVAQELGIDSVPAIVRAPEKAHIEELRFRR